MKSKLFTIDTRDLYNGILLAFLAAILSGLIGILDNGAVFTWTTLKPVLIAATSAALSYVLKSLATNSHNQLFTREPV
jgi:Na+-translocating ferredoxin:NAD+ oxidoreductase RnfG subunit